MLDFLQRDLDKVMVRGIWLHGYTCLCWTFFMNQPQVGFFVFVLLFFEAWVRALSSWAEAVVEHTYSSCTIRAEVTSTCVGVVVQQRLRGLGYWVTARHMDPSYMVVMSHTTV